MYRVRELYGCTGVPNEGVKWEAGEIGRKIKEIETTDRNLRGKKITGIADPAIFAQSGGMSIAEILEREGVYFEKADNTRLAGKMQLHNRLAFDERGIPMLYVFNTCKHFIRTLPALVYSQTDVEDVDTDGEDHIYDECRYVAMAHPIAPPKKIFKKPYEYNPLETQSGYGAYEWYERK